MKKIILLPLLILLLVSCKKNYSYGIWRREPISGEIDGPEVQVIKASNDLDAYQEGLNKYAAALFAYKVIMSKTGNSTLGEPYCYVVATPDAKRVVLEVDVIKAYDMQKKSLNTLREMGKEYNLEFEDHEIIGRDLIK